MASNSKAVKEQVDTLKSAFDSMELAQQFSSMFTSVVQDVTDPRFQSIVAATMVDAANLAKMKADGADQKHIDELAETIKARASAIGNIPGLVTANRLPAFDALFSKATTLVVSVGFNILRAYAGLPPAPVVA